MKKSVCLITLSFAALALAQSATSIGSYGHGTASDGHGRVAMFDYNMSKTAHRPHPVLVGSLTFTEHGHHEVVVEMGRPTKLAVVRHVSEFSGPGSLRHHDAHGHPVTIHGHVSVRVEDNRDPHHPGHHADRFHLRFQARGTNYSFQGGLTEGDLTVFSKR